MIRTGHDNKLRDVEYCKHLLRMKATKGRGTDVYIQTMFLDVYRFSEAS